jgi:protein-disulfide isomerase
MLMSFRMKRYLPFIIIALVLAGTVLGGYAFYRSRLRELTRQTSAPPPEPGGLEPHARGDADAPVTVEEFGDFECPSCGLVFKTLREVEREYGREKLRVIFYEYPLERHRYGMLAARAAEAAGLQGHFWEMHDMLYENQHSWVEERPLPTPPAPGATVAPEDIADPSEMFREYARKIGLDLAKFQRDLESREVETRIQADRNRADSMDVRMTPALFVNGRRLLNRSMDPHGLREAIDAALAKKRGDSTSPHPEPTGVAGAK